MIGKLQEKQDLSPQIQMICWVKYSRTAQKNSKTSTSLCVYVCPVKQGSKSRDIDQRIMNQLNCANPHSKKSNMTLQDRTPDFNATVSGSNPVPCRSTANTFSYKVGCHLEWPRILGWPLRSAKVNKKYRILRTYRGRDLTISNMSF
jgi:hypothetical protein